jgi:hypothetical protein
MTLEPLHSEFPYIRGKFVFLFNQCRLVKLKPGKWSNCDCGVLRCLTKNLPKFHSRYLKHSPPLHGDVTLLIEERWVAKLEAPGLARAALGVRIQCLNL